MISVCCAFASGDPEPLRPVFICARRIGVEPLLFFFAGSAPDSSKVRTALAQRVRTALWRGETPILFKAFGSAPASMRRLMAFDCAFGFHRSELGVPIAAA